jgi:glycosyltransferase involved in cell wall biosynthesis
MEKDQIGTNIVITRNNLVNDLFIQANELYYKEIDPDKMINSMWWRFFTKKNLKLHIHKKFIFYIVYKIFCFNSYISRHSLIVVYPYIHIFSKKHTEVTLAMIGGGNNKLEQELKKLVKKCNLEKNIHILGYLDDEEAFGILKSSKIFVFPSHEEGFGISILEAMTCGLPVVAYDLPTYKSIYGNNILKVPIGDFKQFAENILKLLNEKQIRDDIGLKGQEFIQKYDWDEIAEGELKILKDIY